MSNADNSVVLCGIGGAGGGRLHACVAFEANMGYIVTAHSLCWVGVVGNNVCAQP
jgi:hypothetical protein